MRFLLALVAFCTVVHGQTPDNGPAEALALAREGNTDGAVAIYRDLLSRDPANMALLRDYATVLSWGERYSEAIPVVDKVLALEPNQPDWALQDFAQIYLYGDALEDALETYEDLIERGDATERTLNRRALTLRWMGRSQDAAMAYRQALALHPASAEGIAGLAYSTADAGDLSAALSQLERVTTVPQDAPPLLRARIRILNWMGRHFEAQRLIAALPADLQSDREILEDRVAAERWGGNPVAAMRDATRLATLFPTDAYRQMSRDLRAEYAHTLTSTFQFSEDVDGLIERTTSQEVAVHLNPAHVLRARYNYRWLDLLTEGRTLVRYDAGWTGTVGRRLTFNALLSSVDYRTPGLTRRLTGDGSMDLAVNDQFRFSLGGGTVVMDAFHSLHKQLTAPYGYTQLVYSPGSRNQIQARYSRFHFSGDIVRERGGVEFSRTLLAEAGSRLKIGWRSNLMRHNVQTADFFSPTSFQSHLGVLQSNGAITGWLDYSGEIAAGWQLEPQVPALHPLQWNGSLALHPGRYWRTTFSVGRSTSSVDRVMPGQYTYSRWSAAASMEFRIP